MTRLHASLLPMVGAAAAWLSVPAASATANDFDRKLAGFSLRYQGETSAHRDRSAFVLPEGVVNFEAIGGPPGHYSLEVDHGSVVERRERTWRWTAPRAPGVYTLTFDGPLDHAITVRAFVMVPASEARDGWLNGYRIGEYPGKPLKGNPLYRPPAGFVEVTKDNEDTRVSPHFRLKQFLCKQEPTGRFPKYVVLQERLLLKLEEILDLVNNLGFKADTLNVMSGYRTPYYNHAIGDVPYSMHQWGSAADVFIDTDRKEQMDDLNRDGKIDVNDARLLYDEVEELIASPELKRFQGGMGYYPGTHAHPPFVHVDVRGTKARWKG